MDRDAVIQEAIQAGIREENLQRLPLYAIRTMIDERRKKKVPPLKADVADAMCSIEDNEHNEDDTRTVVNMDHVTSTTNPADQKYKRFSFLISARNELLKAIRTNTDLLNNTSKDLDPDDILAVRHDIEQAQFQFDLIDKEIREIHQWFSEVQHQKQVFYEQFLKKSTDLTGNLTAHFQQKMLNIQKYVNEMTQQLK